MIPDDATNFVYFSELLKTNPLYTSVCDQLTAILDSCYVSYDFLPNTRDIWARDYMPIQVAENKFIEYRYDPDYLQGKKYRGIKTYPDIVCDAIKKLKTTKTDIILDGGNVIKSSDAIILTDKVVEENKEYYKREELISKLKQIFEVEKVILIPWDKKNDKFGHSDGIVRFISNETVVIQGYFDSYAKEFQDKLYGTLEENCLDWKKLEYNVSNEDERNWAYINFLRMKELILVPKLGFDEDDQALNQIKKLFPYYAKQKRIFQVDVTEIVNEGGALNCISWTIKSDFLK